MVVSAQPESKGREYTRYGGRVLRALTVTQPASLLLERLQREVEVQARALAPVRQITEVLQRSVMDGGALDPEAARP